MVEELLAASHELPGLRLIVATDTNDGRPTDDATTITVDRVGGRRRALLDTLGGRIEAMLDDDIPDEGELVLRPAVLGRALTPLEHRIAQRSQPTIDPFVAECVDLGMRARVAAGDARRPSLLPSTLPASVDTDTFFRERPGDSVPIGLVDVPADEPVPLWWQPDDSPLLAFGSARSGVDDLLATIVLGIVDRFAPDDAVLAVVDRSLSRRRAIDGIDQCQLTVDPDRPDEIRALLEAVEGARGPDDASLVVIIDDLGRLRSSAAVTGDLERLDRALAATRSLVAVARSAEAAGSLITSTGRHLVAALDEPDDHRRLGLDDAQVIHGPRGRCRLVETGETVQLAAPAEPLSALLAERLAEQREDS